MATLRDGPPAAAVTAPQSAGGPTQDQPRNEQASEDGIQAGQVGAARAETAGPALSLSEAAVDRLLEQWRGHGGRRTPGRRAILRVLLAAEGHLTTQQVVDRVRAQGWAIDFSTVHRSLIMLVELGLFHTLPSPGSPAYGPIEPDHHHGICTVCGRVQQIPSALLTGAKQAAGHVTRTDLQITDLTLHGRCSTCR